MDSSIIKSRLAERIAPEYLEGMAVTSNAVNHKEIMDAFTAQSGDLFTYVWNYSFSTDVSEESRLVVFLQLASQYGDQLDITDTTATKDKYEYPLIYAK